MNTQTCCKCDKEAAIELDYGQRWYCRNHFLEMIEKRVRKEIRKFYSVDFDETYYVYDDGSAAFEVMKYFTDNIFDDYLDIHVSKDIENSQYYFEPVTMEEALENMIQAFFENRSFNFSKTKKPLRVVMGEEIKILTDILDIDREVEHVDHEFIEKMQEKYSSSKFSMLKSLKYFQHDQELE